MHNTMHCIHALATYMLDRYLYFVLTFGHNFRYSFATLSALPISCLSESVIMPTPQGQFQGDSHSESGRLQLSWQEGWM